jgi:protein-S-isoprenylcysteine O-methyltransferase Ste14
MNQKSLLDRGGWYVLVQGLLIALILFGPQGASLIPDGINGSHVTVQVIGYAVALAGLCIAAIAVFNLGKNLTPLPYPKDEGLLVQTGLYQYVRHPIYSGVILVALGWLLIYPNQLILLYVICLLIFFDLKTRKEEIWLSEKFPEYIHYRKRVKKLIPGLY